MSLFRPHRRVVSRIAVIVLSAVAVGTLSDGLARPQAAATPTPTISQIRKQIDDLHDQAEAASEQYNAAKEQLASLNVRLSAAQARVAEQQRTVDRAREALGRIAADTYKAGDLATLSLFLGDDPDNVVAANGVLISLGDRKAEAVTTLQDGQRRLAGNMTDVQEQQERLAQTKAQIEASRAAVQAKLAQANAILGRLTGDQRGDLARTRSTGDRNSLSDLGIKVPASGRVACDDVPVTPPDARVAKVLGYACAKLGDPYQWAGTGPSVFDCSGLTRAAWAQAGISLPHNAAMQAGFGTKVSASQLQPGDLVFYHSPISHVGIAVGNGVMLDAPRTGDVVKIEPIRFGDLVTAVRL